MNQSTKYIWTLAAEDVVANTDRARTVIGVYSVGVLLNGRRAGKSIWVMYRYGFFLAYLDG